MGATEDHPGVKSRSGLLTSLQNEQTKEHIVLDANDRPVFIFQAPISTEEGGPCLCTEYIYKDAGSVVVVSRQERAYGWKTIWENAFVFDPTVDYDLDGDGIL